MEELGRLNLFTSEFIIGTLLPENKDLNQIETLHNWIQYKDKDLGMRKYRPENTTNISFLYIIDLEIFKEILNDLVIIYSKSYPNAIKKDFINYTFSNTLLFIEKFINIHDWNFNPYSARLFDKYEIYNCDEFYYPNIIDIFIDPSKNIIWYRQYYIKIIELLNNLDFGNIISNSKLTPPKQNEIITNKLKVKQIALIHVYERNQITRQNATEIASRYGYKSKNSGEGLFQDYTTFCSPSNRHGKPDPCTRKKLKNKIDLFESITEHLSDTAKQWSYDEIKLLKTHYETEYQ